MKSLLRRLFAGGGPPTLPRFDTVAVDAPAVYIGDIHGRADLLADLLRLLDRDPDLGAARLVFVGDYVDRGEMSREVLETLMELTRNSRRDVRCLAGNHEEFLLSCLDRPETALGSWVANGGLQTLASFGVVASGAHFDGDKARGVGAALQAAMGREMIEWLRALPRWDRNGTLVAVHAGADPDLPIEIQTDSSTLLWGHSSFGRVSRRDGVWILHGHTIHPTPTVYPDGRIAIDTGAYATGQLTAAVLIPGQAPRFLQTGQAQVWPS